MTNLWPGSSRRKERTQINKKEMKQETNNQSCRNTQKAIWEYYKQLYVNKFNNPEEMDKYLETYSPPKLNQEEIHNFKRPITRGEIEF